MAEPIRYYMDQHYPAHVTQGLRQLGIDVLTVQEARRCGLADPDQLAFATAGERVMVTFDTDYLALHQAGVQHAGIAWSPQQKYGIGMLIQLLEPLSGSPTATRCATEWNTYEHCLYQALGRRAALHPDFLSENFSFSTRCSNS